MKDTSITLPTSPAYNPESQCIGKTKYTLKRRAIKQAQKYAAETEYKYTVYECPHCHFYHIGKVW